VLNSSLFCAVPLRNVASGVQINKTLFAPLAILFCTPLSKRWRRF